ncbi:hypothetical protein [Helicobacter suis]|uniref:hypothetical protein n=1 Tax=Helicobacter suis TaxID=104628 RepID=UPI0013D69047|nr:hypothetical protein [Helicobacter suis]
MFKSPEFLDTKKYLVELNLGAYADKLHINSLDNIIYAELEYQANKQDPLYDFSTITMRYSKTFEEETYRFMQKLVDFLAKEDPDILEITWDMQGKEFSLRDLPSNKPNLGSYRHILSQKQLKDAIYNLPKDLSKSLHLIRTTLIETIKTFQENRNKSAHGNEKASLQEAQTLRDKILGIKNHSILKEMIASKESFALKPTPPKNEPLPSKPTPPKQPPSSKPTTPAFSLSLRGIRISRK